MKLTENKSLSPGKKKKRLIILSLCIIGVISFFIIWKNYQVPDKDVPAIEQNLGDQETTSSASTGIAIPGWGDMTIPAGETEVSVKMPNPTQNADKYYLSFEIILADSGEVLAQTGLVPPGETVNKVSLSRPLEAGQYQAVIHVQPYKMNDEQTPTNDANVEVTLNVS